MGIEIEIESTSYSTDMTMLCISTMTFHFEYVSFMTDITWTRLVHYAVGPAVHYILLYKFVYHLFNLNINELGKVN